MEKGRIIELIHTVYTPVQNMDNSYSVDMHDMTYKVGRVYKKSNMKILSITSEVIGEKVFFHIENQSLTRGERGERMTKTWMTLSDPINLRIKYDCGTIINSEIE